MPIWGDVELLCRAVTDEAEEDSKRILGEAEAEAARIMAEAEAQASKVLAAKMRAHQGEAMAEARHTVDSAELEARKRIISFQEDLFLELYQDLAQRLKDFRNEPEYRRFLLAGIEEGVQSLPGNGFVVELNAEDQNFLEGQLESIAERLNARIHVKTSATLDGGARIYTADRRLLIDNAFSARLKRAEEEIRREIWRTFFGTDRSTPQ